MTLAIITLLTGLSLSTISAYYSVLGLMAIFAASPIPIMVMGGVLEVSKLVATVWLKQNWDTAPRAIKIYLFSSVIILMIITSIGCFGFLSKSHSDQSLPGGEMTQQLSILDEKIKSQRDIIDTNRKSLQQLDAAVDQIMARSDDERGAARSSSLRRSQQKERNQLQNEIEAARKKISELTDQRAPIASSLRKIEVEVGPIKYIAAFFYGDTNQELLEKAVIWVIIILIVVFDPLAVILLLASQISFQKSIEKRAASPPLTEEPKKKDAEEIFEKSFSTNESIAPRTFQVYQAIENKEHGIESKNIDTDVKSESKEQDLVLESKNQELEFNIELENREPVGNNDLEIISGSLNQESENTVDLSITADITPEENKENYVNEELEKFVDQLIGEVKEAIEKNPKPYHWAEPEIDHEYENPTENPIPISENDYQNLSKKNFEKEIQKWVEMVKNNQVRMADIPKSILLEVRARI